MKFAIAMAQHGQAVWWNIAFQFLRFYDFIFRRISHGATRLQEVLADRVAAQKYGAAQFEEGLRHVIQRSVEFQLAASREINGAMEMRRSLRNLYAVDPSPEDAVSEKVAEALNRPATEDDTHPAPLERFRLVSGVQWSGDPTAGMVWDLFADAESLMAEVTATVESHVRDASVVA